MASALLAKKGRPIKEAKLSTKIPGSQMYAIAGASLSLKQIFSTVQSVKDLSSLNKFGLSSKSSHSVISDK